jgi:hypothetical protein
MELMPMSEVKSIIVQVASPRDNFPGQTTTGYYVVEGDLLTMTDASGIPIRTPGGDFYTHKLGPDENPRRMANALTKEVRRAIRGNSSFNGPIDMSHLNRDIV